MTNNLVILKERRIFNKYKNKNNTRKYDNKLGKSNKLNPGKLQKHQIGFWRIIIANIRNDMTRDCFGKNSSISNVSSNG